MLRVGLTYDLRQDYLDMGFGEEETAEFDSPRTIEGLETALADLGFAVERVGHVKKLAEKLVGGARWDFVFNICEGVSGLGRESQVPCLLDAYGIPYVFSDPLTTALTLDKAMAKKLHDNVMSVGNSIDPAIAYRNMMGRDVDVTAYLRDKGFPTT